MPNLRKNKQKWQNSEPKNKYKCCKLQNNYRNNDFFKNFLNYFGSQQSPKGDHSLIYKYRQVYLDPNYPGCVCVLPSSKKQSPHNFMSSVNDISKRYIGRPAFTFKRIILSGNEYFMATISKEDHEQIVEAQIKQKNLTGHKSSQLAYELSSSSHTATSTTTSHADALPFIHTFASENATNASEEETATGLAEDVENTKKYKLLTPEDFQTLPETTPKGDHSLIYKYRQVYLHPNYPGCVCVLPSSKEQSCHNFISSINGISKRYIGCSAFTLRRIILSDKEYFMAIISKEDHEQIVKEQTKQKNLTCHKNPPPLIYESSSSSHTATSTTTNHVDAVPLIHTSIFANAVDTTANVTGQNFKMKISFFCNSSPSTPSALINTSENAQPLDPGSCTFLQQGNNSPLFFKPAAATTTQETYFEEEALPEPRTPEGKKPRFK